MSLNKKLWLAIVFILILASGGSFILSTLFSKHYLEEQLQLKNLDNATSLALSMSQLPKDRATIDLLISAQFDSGHYKYIGLFDPSGKLITQRTNTRSQTKAPKWFTAIFPIKTEIGVAEIQDGWSQYGTLNVESNPNFAYDELWKSTLLILIWSIAIGLVSGYAGNHTLRKILRPLKDIVNQATAIGEHRFITIIEPKTQEFKAVVSAMNSLSNRIKNMVNEESARLDELQYRTNFDPITGLMNRQYFMSNIDAHISRKEYFNQGVLVTLRLSNLALIDQTLGYQKTNDFLKTIGTTLENACFHQPSLIAGRLSGTDFAIFSNIPMDAFSLGNNIKNLLENINVASDIELNPHIVSAAATVTPSDAAVKLLKRLNFVLDDISDNHHENIVHILNQEVTPNHLDVSRIEWEILLNSALNDNRIMLQRYPVVNQQGKLIHFESPVRLQLHKDGKWFSAGEFLAWAIEIELISRIDALVVETATNILSIGAQPIGLNISAESIRDADFTRRVAKLIQSNLSIANLLCFEIPERGAFEHFSEFKAFCKMLKGFGCKIGIEHVGSRISRLGELHDVGLDYIKIDVSIIRDIDTNEANKTLLRGLCMIAHSIGVLAIAEGVQTNNEIEALKLIGIDGMTGPGINFS